MSLNLNYVFRGAGLNKFPIIALPAATDPSSCAPGAFARAGSLIREAGRWIGGQDLEIRWFWRILDCATKGARLAPPRTLTTEANHTSQNSISTGLVVEEQTMSEDAEKTGTR